MAGIYIASKVIHAQRWRNIRDSGFPISCTWIDKAGPGEIEDWPDFWDNCINEVCDADCLILYKEPGEVLKGAILELGVALRHHVSIIGVGIQEYTFAVARPIVLMDNMILAVQEANRIYEKNREALESTNPG